MQTTPPSRSMRAKSFGRGVLMLLAPTLMLLGVAHFMFSAMLIFASYGVMIVGWLAAEVFGSEPVMFDLMPANVRILEHLLWSVGSIGVSQALYAVLRRLHPDIDAKSSEKVQPPTVEC